MPDMAEGLRSFIIEHDVGGDTVGADFANM